MASSAQNATITQSTAVTSRRLGASQAPHHIFYRSR